MAGLPYDMNDPAWLLNGMQNRNTFAFKIFAGLLMLGYQTESYAAGGERDGFCD